MANPDYLVQYGRTAYVGRFAAPDGEAFGRGDAVVVRSPRGLETGVVLCEADDRFPASWDGAAGGELVRHVTPADESQLTEVEAFGRTLLAAAESDAAHLPLTFLDVEVTLDRAAAVLHVLPWGECVADGLFAAWSSRFGLGVRMLDVARTPVATEPAVEVKSGCSSCDTGGGCSSCGTEKSGCSTGGCSRGAVKTADDLTDYFADLRQKMEAQTASRRPLY